VSSGQNLDKTIDKVLIEAESEIVKSLKKSLAEAQNTLDSNQNVLEQVYENIIAEGKKESEKLEKQITGNADLSARNSQLVLVEESVQKVFQKAIEKIKESTSGASYSQLITKLIQESVDVLGTPNIVIQTNKKDKDTVKSVISKFSGATLSDETIDCLGGVLAKTKDGLTKFDNTIDSRIDRMKPLIRKDIASKFGR
jgi:V/A-type H+-transporting ATPase subunit E